MLAPRNPSRFTSIDLHFQVLKGLLRKHLLNNDVKSAGAITKLLFRHAENFETDAKSRLNVPGQFKGQLETFTATQLALDLFRREEMSENRINRWLRHMNEIATGPTSIFILTEWIMYLVSFSRLDDAQTHLRTTLSINDRQNEALLHGYLGMICYLLWLDNVVQSRARNTGHSNLWDSLGASQMSFMSQASNWNESMVEDGNVEGEPMRAANLRRQAVESLGKSLQLDPHNDLFLLLRVRLYYVAGQVSLMVDDLTWFLERNPNNPNAYKYFLEHQKNIPETFHLHGDKCKRLLQLDPHAEEEFLKPILTLEPLDRRVGVLLRYLDANPHSMWSWQQLNQVTFELIETGQHWQRFADARRDWWPQYVMSQWETLELEQTITKLRENPTRVEFVEAISQLSDVWIVGLRIFPEQVFQAHGNFKQVLAFTHLSQEATQRFLGIDNFNTLQQIKNTFNIIPSLNRFDDGFQGITAPKPRPILSGNINVVLQDLLRILASEDKQERSRDIFDMLLRFIPGNPGTKAGGLKLETLQKDHGINVPALFVEYLEREEPLKYQWFLQLRNALEAFRAVPSRTKADAAERDRLAGLCHLAAVNVRKHIAEELGVAVNVFDHVLGIRIAHLLLQPIPKRGFSRK